MFKYQKFFVFSSCIYRIPKFFFSVNRIPEEIKGNKNIQYIFNGAIDVMKKKVSANYKIAVPQYFNGKIQLLLPLCLVDPEVPDLALVVTKN